MDINYKGIMGYGSSHKSYIHFVDPNSKESLEEFYNIFPKH